MEIVSTIQLNKGVSSILHLSIHPTIVCYISGIYSKKKLEYIEYKMKDRNFIKIESIDNNLFFHIFIFPIFLQHTKVDHN